MGARGGGRCRGKDDGWNCVWADVDVDVDDADCECECECDGAVE